MQKFLAEFLQTPDKLKAGATSLEVIRHSSNYIPSKFSLGKLELEDLISYADDAGDFRFDIKWGATKILTDGKKQSISIFIDTKNYSSASNMFKDLRQFKAYLAKVNNFDEMYIIQQGGRSVTQEEIIRQLERAIAKDAQSVFYAKQSLWESIGIDNFNKLKNMADSHSLSEFKQFSNMIKITE